MRRILLSITFLSLFPLLAIASFDQDLYFGRRADPEVAKLQEFLGDQDVYAGPITGNFFSLTQDAVKKFQEREGIKPSAGYFGPVTRARANELLQSGPQTQEELIAGLAAKIKALQEQLVALQAKLVQEQAAEPAPATTPEEKPAATLPSNKLLVSNSATSTFPAVVVTLFKIGEITLHNDTARDILFIRLETILSDEMDSTSNRNQLVYFLLRDGTTAIDPLISSTKFTFLLTPPSIGSPHKAVLYFPFAVTLKAGEKKTVGLWVEQLQYVRSGTLKIESTAIVTSETVAIDGGIGLILTKEPPL